MSSIAVLHFPSISHHTQKRNTFSNFQLWKRFDKKMFVSSFFVFLRHREVLGFGSRRLSCMVARYPGGGARYARHRDALPAPGDAAPRRRLTAVYYLNEAWHPQVLAEDNVA